MDSNSSEVVQELSFITDSPANDLCRISPPEPLEESDPVRAPSDHREALYFLSNRLADNQDPLTPGESKGLACILRLLASEM